MIKKIAPCNAFKGKIALPGDKSISHRAVIFNSIAGGNAVLENFPQGDDCWATVDCMKAMAVKIEPGDRKDILKITGTGRKGLTKPDKVLDARNSGTTMRILTGLLAAQNFSSTITGDASLRSRPMERIIKPLNLMGAEVHSQNNDSRAPLVIQGKKLHGIEYHLPIASAQVKSSLILAALFANSPTVITEPAQSRDHTERLLKIMGANLNSKDLAVTITPEKSPLSSINIRIPGDISSAAYWMVAGAIHPDAHIELLNVGINPTRTGIIDVLLEMGANLKIVNYREQGGEPVADLIISSSKLKGIPISGAIIPRLIDEVPILTVAAAVADGVTTIRDAAELRVKESDRITTTSQQLSKLGARIQTLPDGLTIEGVKQLHGAECDSMGDHRLAMTLGIAAVVAKGETHINNAEAINISYPTFWEHLQMLRS